MTRLDIDEIIHVPIAMGLIMGDGWGVSFDF